MSGESKRLGFGVMLDKPVNKTVTVEYRTADGSAKAGSDYTAKNGTVTFAPNETRKQILVDLLPDSIPDHRETMRVWIENGTGGAVVTAFNWGIGTIYDTKPFITVGDASGTEGTDATLDFPVRLSTATKRDVTVNYGTSDGTATAGQNQDYTTTSGTLTFERGETEKIVSVPLLDDARAESDEQLTLTLESPQNAHLRDPDANGQIKATGTILNAVPLTASIGDASGTEGSGQTIDFVVTLNRPTVRRVTINVLFSSGSADFSDVDVPEPNSVTFEPGETRKTFAVRIVNDSENEPQETFSMVLQSPLPSDVITLADSSGAGTIYNSESLTARFFNLPTHHDGSSAFTVDVHFSTDISTSAAALRDHAFTTTGATVTGAEQIDNRKDRWQLTLQPAGDRWATITTVPKADCDAAGAICTDEDHPVQLGNSPAATILGPQAVETTEPTASITGGTATEGTDAAVIFTVTLDEAATDTVTVDYASADGSATAGSDYTSTSGTLTFDPDSTSQTITVPIANDSVNESDETFTLTLSNASGASLGTSTATGTIANRTIAVPPRASITGGGNVTEGTDTSVTFTVSLDKAASRSVTLDYATSDGTATAGSDYTSTSGTLTFAAGTTSRTITVPIADDSVNESDETFMVTLSNPSGATLATSSAGATIINRYVPPLTASFANMPAEHDGSNVFTFRLRFSESPAVGYTVLRDESFAVTGGEVDKARRVGERNDLREIHVEPAGYHEVTLTLAGGRPCGTYGAICTADGRALSNTLTATVQGPPALNVADARAVEGEDATLDFVVTLSRAASGTVSVDYATADGSATAGEDYTATSGTLTFAAGETTKTVSVPLLDDVVNDGGETFTLTLSNPSGAWIEDGEATGTIENDDAMPAAWTARFGRSVATHVLGALEARLDGTSQSYVRLGGHQLGGGPDVREAVQRLAPEGNLSLWEEAAADGAGQEMTVQDLLLGSAFHLIANDSEETSGPRLSAWGRVATSGFDGKEDKLSLNGTVTTATLGVDGVWDHWLTGVALAYSEGDGSFAQVELPGGDVASSLTSVHPYAAWALSDRVRLWGMLGYGSGSLQLRLAERDALDTDLAMTMGALGIRGSLLEPSQENGLALALRSDVLWLRMDTAAVAGMAATEADVSRLRLVLEGSRPVALASGGLLIPTLEVGLRRDGGDAETGSGVEVGGSLRYASAWGLSVEASVRGLLAHEAADYREWGASGALRFDPGQKGLGLTASIVPAWGSAASGVDRLWGQPQASGLAPGHPLATATAGRLDAELGYGLAALRGRGLLTPYARMALSEGSEQAWHLGARLALPASLNFSVEASRRARDGDAAAHELALLATLGW